MNLTQIGDLIKEFFYEFFNIHYLPVSIPFIFVISSSSIIATSYYYKSEIKYYKGQKDLYKLYIENINHQNNQMIELSQYQNQQSLIPYHEYNNLNYQYIVPSAPTRQI